MDFIQLAQSGKNDWWRYVLSSALIFFLWLIVGSIPLILIIIVNGGMPFPWEGEPGKGPMSAYDPFITFYLPIAFSFLMLFIALYISAIFIHCRTFASLVSARFRKGRILQGFAFFLALNALSVLASFALHPSAFIVTLDPMRLIIIAPFFILLTALQVAAEEILMRGYVLQGLTHFLKRPIFAILISSFLFMLLHFGNPEMANGFLFSSMTYLFFGLWFAYLTVKDDGMELALGAHFATNIFVLFVNYESSALETIPSVLKINGFGSADIVISFVFMLVFSALSLPFLFGKTTGKAPQAL